MEQTTVRVYGYRWIVLLVVFGINLVIQMQWLTFAPIAREARLFYQATPLQVDFLSMLFMIVFLVMCLPAAWVIDTWGLRIGMGIGALLTGAFAVFKGVCAADYTLMVVAQTGLAIAQPFILNASTKMAVQWFPVHERATAVGIATLAQFVGIVAVMVATPALVAGDDGYTLPQVLRFYGIAAAAGAVALLVLLREKPPTPPSEETGRERFKMMSGLVHMFKDPAMRLLVLLFFIGLGLFNAISTCIDQVCQLKGLTMEQTGLVGGMILIAGIAGALILPPLSDRLRKRKAFLLLGMACMIPGLAGLTFFTGYPVLLVSAFVFGFFFLGAAGPVGYQYGAEISVPAPESASMGLLTLAGQVSGILFIVGMNTLGMISFMVFFVALAILNVFLCARLPESPLMEGGPRTIPAN